MAAETQALILAVGEGYKLCRTVADMRGNPQGCRMPHLWLTDCESLHKYLINPVASGTEDKRLEIDLEDLRQMLWEDDNGMPKDEIWMDAHDKIRWIDTSTMLADPMTKFMQPTRLLKALESCVVDLSPTAETQLQKMLKQKQRASKSSDLAHEQNDDG